MISQNALMAYLILLCQLAGQFTVRSGLPDPLLQIRGLVIDLGGEDRGVPGRLIGWDAIDLRRLTSLFALSASSTIDLVTASEMSFHCNSVVSLWYRVRGPIADPVRPLIGSLACAGVAHN
jgi:hypothetical protein